MIFLCDILREIYIIFLQSPTTIPTYIYPFFEKKKNFPLKILAPKLYKNGDWDKWVLGNSLEAGA